MQPVNSYTFSFSSDTMLFKRYNITLLICLGLALIPSFLMTVYIDPVYRELSRLGGYTENHYGENLPQEHFERPLFEKAHTIEEYKGYYDVVIIGDSFSENVSHGWQNYLVKHAGFSVIMFNMNWIPRETILNSENYKKHPPKLVIYESVERNLLHRHPTCSTTEAERRAMAQLPFNLTYSPNPIDVQIEMTHRPTDFFDLDRFNYGSTINYIKKALPRLILNRNITQVHKFNINNPNLFSSKVKDSMLVVTKDFIINGRTEEQIDTAKCNLLELQTQVKTGGKTEFIALIFPDKTTMYNDYITNKNFTERSILKQIEATEGLQMAKLLSRFTQAVENGVKDVYLPTDTHCGYIGYKMAAEAVIELLEELG